MNKHINKQHINLTDEQIKKLKIEDNRIDHYFKVENALVDKPNIFDNIYDAHLFVVLCRYCNNNSIAFPGYTTLAEQCYCSRRTVINAMKSLEKKGYINKVTRSYIKKGKKINETNIYTINNLIKYKQIEPSAENTPVLVQDIHYINAPITPNKELDIKNNNINTTSSSQVYEFLENEEFKEFLNKVTKKNIRNNIKNLNEQVFRETYNLISKEYLSGKIKNFNAVLYLALIDEWIFQKENNEELDSQKKEWLKHFSGIYSNQKLRIEIENIIADIPFETLKKNKSKLSKMDIFNFKNTLYQLKNQNLQL